MKTPRFTLHPLFLVLIIIAVYYGYFLLLFSYMAAVLLHEMAHGIVAGKLGYKLNKITLMPYGASISGNAQNFLNKDEIKIALAGPIINLVLWVLTIALWWLFPVLYVYTEYFALANLVTACINIFPVFPLDGGRVMLCLLSIKMPRKKALKILKVTGYAISLMLAGGFFISTFFKPNYTILFLALFLFCSTVFDTPQNVYTRNLFTAKKESSLQKGINIKSVAISAKTPLYKMLAYINNNALIEFRVYSTQHKLIGTLTEFQLHTLMQKVNLETEIGTLFRQKV